MEMGASKLASVILLFLVNKEPKIEEQQNEKASRKIHPCSHFQSKPLGGRLGDNAPSV